MDRIEAIRQASRGFMDSATVLFTDLAGSTQLLALLGDDAFDELRRGHFTLLRGVLARIAEAPSGSTSDRI